MHVLITGAAGMIGRKLAESIAGNGAIKGRKVTRMSLADVVEPVAPEGFDGDVALMVTDLATPGAADDLVAGEPDVIFHLAAIVSGEAEADFEKGYLVNLDGTRALFDAIRHIEGYVPRVVFASSLAVFGAPLPEKIEDDFHLTPLTSYGTQKAIGELLLSDYSRRGFLDGIGLRFPTICIRPGAPNKAASSFFSGILREPLRGQTSELPVSQDVRHYHASPRAAVGFLEHAATLDTDQLGSRRNLTMPGVSATVGDQIAALSDVAGAETASLIRNAPNPIVADIVAGWPRDFVPDRARSLGFEAESSFHEIIEIYIQDELGRL